VIALNKKNTDLGLSVVS